MSCIYLNGKEIFFEKDADNYLNEGCEAEVYIYKDLVLKFYKERSIKTGIDKEMVEYLKLIKTKRYLLPIASITNEISKFLGYATKFMQHYQTMYSMAFMKFVDELKLLEEDTLLLSENKVDIDDLTYNNTIYNGSLYITDPGSFILDPKSESLSASNLQKLNTYIVEELLENSLSKPLSRNKKIEIAKDIKQKLASSPYQFMSDFLQNEVKKSKNVRDCTKRLIKL